LKITYLFLCFAVIFSCKDKGPYIDLNKNEGKEDFKVNFDDTRMFYLNSLNNSINYLEELKIMGARHENSKILFASTREEYKKAEIYAAYLNPSVSKKVNGPAIYIYNEDNSTTIPPIGLQRIEECIYSIKVNSKQFIKEINVTIGLLRVLKSDIQKRELTPERFFISTHQHLLRIITHSITGLDSPVSQLGLHEAIISLKSLEKVYNQSIRHLIQNSDSNLDKSFIKNIQDAIHFIEGNNNFENFDRYTFIKYFINPLTRNWVKIRKSSGLWKGTNNFPFNFDSPTFFEKDFFNINYFMPAINRDSTPKEIALGKKLFFDQNLSRKGNMACASCHLPQVAFSGGVAFNRDNEGNYLKRNTPSLINVVFQKNFFWDGRSQTLIDQISSVFLNEKEFDIGVHSFSKEILEDPAYKEMFIEAYGQVSQRNMLVVKAITSYIGALNAFNSKFDRNIRDEEDTYTLQEKQGFNLFAGKALCATCHFIPLMNGTAPPFYKETEREIIGVPETKENLKLDEDYGAFWQYNSEVHKGMFKTPSLRNLELSSPYMHNGVFITLEEVIDFYDSGGGAGLGLDVPYQTLPSKKLNLSDKEKKALISYLKTLNDYDVGMSN
jgi:cytochrome c peroxidase